jgi:hypothetical protein
VVETSLDGRAYRDTVEQAKAAVERVWRASTRGLSDKSGRPANCGKTLEALSASPTDRIREKDDF